MEQRAFMSKMAVFKDKAFRLAHRLLVSKQEAEDAVQDLYVKLWQKKEDLDKLQNIESFAMRVLKNHCLDVLKSKRANNVSLELLHQQGMTESFEKRMDADSDVNTMRMIIDRLPEEQRMIIQLRDIEQYEFDAIARILGATEGAVRVKLSRARKALKVALLKELKR